jgi:hypothetical protein
MKDLYMVETKYRLTRHGIYLMLASFLIGMVVSVGSLLSMSGVLNTDTMSGPKIQPSTALVSLLTPWAIIIEIVAIIFILVNSRAVGGRHRRLVVTAAWFFAVWAALNVGGFLPLTFAALRQGSLTLLRTGQAVKAVAAILQYSIPFLMIFGIAVPSTKKLLWAALILTVVGNFSTVLMGGMSMELRAVEATGMVSHVPRLVVDYTKGFYPVLLGLGYAGGLAYILAYAVMLTRMDMDAYRVHGAGD